MNKKYLKIISIFVTVPFLFSQVSYALPEGEQLVSGNASFGLSCFWPCDSGWLEPRRRGSGGVLRWPHHFSSKPIRVHATGDV